jgi:hypothetical protein
VLLHARCREASDARRASTHGFRVDPRRCIAGDIALSPGLRAQCCRTPGLDLPTGFVAKSRITEGALEVLEAMLGRQQCLPSAFPTESWRKETPGLELRGSAIGPRRPTLRAPFVH